MNRCDQADQAIADALADWQRSERAWPGEYCDPAQREARFERYAIEHQDDQAALLHRVRGPGLVSVPTRAKRSWRPSVPFRIQADATARLADACAPVFGARDAGARRITAFAATLDAFAIDTDARRLAQLRMGVGFAARGHLVNVPEGWRCAMVTLTYAGTNDAWSALHIKRYLDHVRKFMDRNGHPLRYVWVAELQGRGVIHYHVALFLPSELDLPMPDEWFARRMRGPVQPARGECAWWPHGYSRIETARAAIPYLLKYLSKDTSKSFAKFPKGARIYGIGGLDFVTRRARRWLGHPSFVRGNASVLDRWDRAPGGGWTSPAGATLPSEFRRVFVGTGPALVREHQHPRTFEADGPYNWLDDRHRALDRVGPTLPRAFACENAGGMQ